jgi:hypothetical protein
MLAGEQTCLGAVKDPVILYKIGGLLWVDTTVNIFLCYLAVDTFRS